MSNLENNSENVNVNVNENNEIDYDNWYNSSIYNYYLYNNSLLSHNLEQNIKLLTVNVAQLSQYNFDNFSKLQTENEYLYKENGRLKRNNDELEYRVINLEKKQKKDNDESHIDQKKYYYRKNKYTFSEEKILELKLSIKTIDDIINLEGLFREIRHDPDLIRLYYCIDSLKKLTQMVGMINVKKEIFKHLIYYIKNRQNENMLHTIITGSPGTGKTELGSILAKIYLAVGALKKDIFKIVKRSDLIAGYLGQTAIKTQKVIDSCDGGVLFIDEAYSLGNNEQRDSFSKECLDTINLNLTEKKNSFMCIIAGYPDELEKCFFAYNAGLERRFSFKYTVDAYKFDELLEIFKRKIIEGGLILSVDDTELTKFFKENYKRFKHFGGDIEKLLFYTKLESTYRSFQQNKATEIEISDIKSTIENFEVIEYDEPPQGLYN